MFAPRAQQLVDRVELSRHGGPVDRLAGPLVALADERRLRVEQLAHLFQIVVPQRRRDRLPCGDALNFVSSVCVSSCSISV